MSIKHIFSILWQDFINLIHLSDRLPKDAERREQVKTLRKDGILFFDNFLAPEKCDELAQKLLALTDGKEKSEELPSGTFINVRSESNTDGSDHGMIDIFYVNKSIPEIDEIPVDFLEDLLRETHNQDVIKLKTHAYVNSGVKGTRGYHIDNTQPVIYKAFVYLTDVTDESYGPYAFIKGSQRFSGQVYKNLFRNIFRKKGASTDMNSINTSKQISCTAPKGTMILSNQNGIHRGIPQDQDKSRIALVFYYTILSKMSYLHKTARKKLQMAREN